MTDLGVERAFLVGIEARGIPHQMGVEESLDELASLIDTAGLQVVGQATQRIARLNPDTLIGVGKLEEVKYWVEELNADWVVFDDELSPRHQRQLEKYFGEDVRVIDRTALILDIFAQHARSREGSLQVSLAQYEYRLPRLTRMWTHLARQSGKGAAGLGLRGPGETQLETDRREIRRHISHLKRLLTQVRKQRHQQRQRRSREGITQVALIGYTNAGKSTLLNALSDSEVYVADKLFATLDPTTRRVGLPDGQTALVSDTVGFIQKLPHQLVAAFRATLEEVIYADILIHVADASHPQVRQQISVVNEFMRTLRPDDSPPVIMVLNKVDLLAGSNDEALVLQEEYPEAIQISAVQRTGLEQITERVKEISGINMRRLVVRIPFNQYHMVARFYETAGEVTQSTYDDGLELCGNIRSDEVGRFDSFLVR